MGDNGSTSIYKGVSLGSWTINNGAPIPAGTQFLTSNGTATFTNTPAGALNFTGTITDSASNGFTFYLNGQNLTLTTGGSLNTSNTNMGVEFDGLGAVNFPTANNNTTGANPGGTAAVYSRVGVFDALNTSGGTLPNTTGNQTLLTLGGTSNFAGKTLNLQNLTFNAQGINAAFLASSGTMNFNAYATMYNSGNAMAQGTFNFAPTAIYRIGADNRLLGGATWNFQTGAMISIADAPDPDNWGNTQNPVPTNVDLVLSTNENPTTVTGTTGFTLGNNRTLSTPWGPGTSNTLNLTAPTAVNAAAGAASIRLAGANGNTLTVNGPLELGNATLIINDIPTNTLYVPEDGTTNFQRQPGGSLLNGIVQLGNITAKASVIPAVYVKGGTLQLTSANALGTVPLAATVGAPDAGATTATLDLNGNNLAVSSLNGASLGVITNSSSTAVAALSVSTSASTTATYAGTLTNGVSKALSLTFNGAGLQVLSGPNSYTGATNISGGGTLQIGNGGATGTLGTAAVTNNATLAFNRSDSGLVVANAISGSGSVLQLGPGVTTLTASNNYGGPTAVLGGTLLVNGSLSPSGTVTVSAGGFLGGSGSAGNTTVLNGGAIDVSRNQQLHVFLAGPDLGPELDGSHRAGLHRWKSSRARACNRQRRAERQWRNGDGQRRQRARSRHVYAGHVQLHQPGRHFRFCLGDDVLEQPRDAVAGRHQHRADWVIGAPPRSGRGAIAACGWAA